MNTQNHSGREDGKDAIVESFSKDTPAEQILNGALIILCCVGAVVLLLYVGVGILCFGNDC